MATFKGEVKKCVTCSVIFKVPACRAKTAIACSYKCKAAWMRTQGKNTITLHCLGCGKEFKEYASHVSRRKYCSRKCHGIYRVRGLFGEDNPAWKGGETIHSDGYKYVNVGDHPFKTANNYVFEHRLVMEEWLRENKPDSIYLIYVDGKLYLDPVIIVHHKNENKLDNDISNLECMTQSEHMKLHHKEAEFLRKQIATLQRKLDNL